VATLFAFSKSEIGSQKMFHVPSQRFDLSGELGVKERHDSITVDSFEISSLITYGEYKKYLDAIKKDSSLQFYQSQFPDSSMCPPEAYAQYVNSIAYDNFPVSGISWDNAMNFCKWKTIRANPKDSFNLVYRLPLSSEWISAFKYLSDKKIPNDFNQDYSDWTLDAKDDTYYGDLKDKYLDYEYYAKDDDTPVLKRKLVLGNSFRFSQENLFEFYSWSYYEFHGYANIGFRYVCKKVQPLVASKNSNFNYSNWSEEHETLSRWGLLKKTNMKRINRYVPNK
jgi:hypothetical protein